MDFGEFGANFGVNFGKSELDLGRTWKKSGVDLVKDFGVNLVNSGQIWMNLG